MSAFIYDNIIIDSDTFAIMEDGTITLIGTLDYEAVTTYNLTVEASDDGSPTLASSIVVTIDVVDVNDNPPLFVVDFGSQGITLSEVIFCQLVMITLNALFPHLNSGPMDCVGCVYIGWCTRTW